MDGSGDHTAAARPIGVKLKEHYEAAMSFVAKKNREKAVVHLDSMFRLGATVTDEQAGLLGAEILFLEGRKDAATALLRAAQRANPASIWLPFKLFECAQAAGKLEDALDYVLAADENDVDKKATRVRMGKADVLLSLGRTDDAIAVLRTIIKQDPKNIWSYKRLSGVLERASRADEALSVLQQALNGEGARVDVLETFVRIAEKSGDFDAAITALQTFLQKNGPNARVSLLLANVSQRGGRRDAQQAAIVEAVRAAPYSTHLLTHAVNHFVSPEEPNMPLDVLERLKGSDVPDDLIDDLEMQALQKTLQTDRMYQRLRSETKTRTAVQARQLAQALFGTYRIALGLRYLRFCLRRWPGDRHLLHLFQQTALKQGAFDSVETVLEGAKEHVPAAAMQTLQLNLAMHRGDFDAAVKLYSHIRKRGGVEKSQRNRMVELLFAGLDPNQAEEVFKKTGNPIAEDPEPRVRFRHFGQLMTELQLELDAFHKDFGGALSLAEWVSARPGSTVAAIRLINHWRETEMAAPEDTKDITPKTETIPAKIVQYWDEATPPDSLEPLIDSWRNIDGYEHEIYNRATARAFIKEHYGIEWVRAFNLSIHPSQEADFFRLCKLAKDGGVYADIDDVLMGDILDLVRPGDQLVLFSQAMGGALGNNFIAVAPDHPAMRLAAEMAFDTLMSRCNETVWSSTGPGLLNRAVAQYLLEVQTQAEGQGAALRVIDWTEIGAYIAMYNPVEYKAVSRHWNRKQPSTKDVWDSYLAALDERAAKQAAS